MVFGRIYVSLSLYGLASDKLPSLAKAVSGRPMKQVRAHLHRRYNPSFKQGKWMLEEDEALEQYVYDLRFCVFVNETIVTEQ